MTDSEIIISKILSENKQGSGFVEILGIKVTEDQLLKLCEFAHNKSAQKEILIQGQPMIEVVQNPVIISHAPYRVTPEELKLLLEHRLDPNFKIYTGFTLATYYATKGMCEHLEILMKFKPDTNIRSIHGITSLEAAMIRLHTYKNDLSLRKCCILLLPKDSILLKNSDSIDKWLSDSSYILSPNLTENWKFLTPCDLKLLLAAGMLLNIPLKGVDDTLLYYYANEGNVEMVSILLQAGMNGITGYTGKSPLDYAVEGLTAAKRLNDAVKVKNFANCIQKLVCHMT